MAAHAARLKAALLRCGHTAFRRGQLEAVTATLEGKDSFLILPTGGGKSLTFQLPPVARGGCFTVVVTPLLALASDQVEKCLEAGLEAAMWNSTTSEQQRKNVLGELTSDCPDLQLLYTTPESLLKPPLRDALKEAHKSGTICAFAIDEAHCISEWGHDFRPAYLQLASLKMDFPGVPVAAVTASATPRVQASIIKCLGLEEPRIVTASFNRPNIELTVRHKVLIGAQGSDNDVVEDLLSFISNRRGQCGIVYARLRSTCDWLASVLSGCDLDVAKYHAGMDNDQRSKVLRDWCEGAVDIVVATIAFGMGIDRSDARWVVHWNLPSSVEGLYQEAGRAGRDGQPSVSLVYESLEDAEAVAKLERANRQGAMASVADLLSTAGCRRRRLLAFFGEKRGSCDASVEVPCDFCADPEGVRRRLAERGRRTQAHQQRERMRLLGGRSDGGRGANGEGEGSGGQDGDEGDGDGGAAGSRDGWGSAALLGTDRGGAPGRGGGGVRLQSYSQRSSGEGDGGGEPVRLEPLKETEPRVRDLKPPAQGTLLHREQHPLQQQQQQQPHVTNDLQQHYSFHQHQQHPLLQQQRQQLQRPARPPLAALSSDRQGNPGAKFKPPQVAKPQAAAPASTQSKAVPTEAAAAAEATEAAATAGTQPAAAAGAAAMSALADGEAVWPKRESTDGRQHALLTAPATAAAAVGTRPPVVVPRLQKRFKGGGAGFLAPPDTGSHQHQPALGNDSAVAAAAAAGAGARGQAEAGEEGVAAGVVERSSTEHSRQVLVSAARAAAAARRAFKPPLRK